MMLPPVRRYGVVAIWRAVVGRSGGAAIRFDLRSLIGTGPCARVRTEPSRWHPRRRLPFTAAINYAITLASVTPPTFDKAGSVTRRASLPIGVLQPAADNARAPSPVYPLAALFIDRGNVVNMPAAFFAYSYRNSHLLPPRIVGGDLSALYPHCVNCAFHLQRRPHGSAARRRNTACGQFPRQGI